jgi:bleomycin hydrolase
MKRTLLAGAMIAAALAVNAQESITPEVLTALKSSYATEASNAQVRALRNAMGANQLKTLALSQDNRAEKDTYFSNTVKSKGITDQKSSGRCWLFTGLNVLRQKMIAHYGLESFTFSQVYTFFYDQLEKSNLFLQNVIDTRKKPMDDKMVEWLFQNPIGDGGNYTGVADLVMKYGVVPSGVMPETYSSESTGEFDRVLTTKLREMGITLREASAKGASASALEKQKIDMMKTVYRMLAMVYGEPVSSFSWAPKNKDGKYKEAPQTYTPKQFYDKFLSSALGTDSKSADLMDVVMLMNNPSRDYYRVYEIDNDRHIYEGHNWKYVNLPIDDIKAMAIASIRDSTSMYFGCDVGKFLNRQTGWLDVNNYDYASLFGTKFTMDKKQRILTFDSGSSHAMTLMAVDLDAAGKPQKWEVENSWGDKGFKGHLIMTDEWFNEYMFRLVVAKKYATPRVIDLVNNSKPIKLPAWDPMFAPEQ